MKYPINILLVEDNEILQCALSELFVQAGYCVFVTDSADGIHDVLRHEIDVVLLDINLPGENGYSIATRLRSSFPRLGIVMLTARGTHNDIIQGYRSGADNYFVKPFNSDLLLSAIESLGARVRSMKETIAPISLALNVSGLLLVCSQDKLDLTPAECALLQHFTMAQNRRLETWQLMDILGLDADDSAARHNLEVIISRLRKKMSRLCYVENAIKSIRGIGYQLMIVISLQ